MKLRFRHQILLFLLLTLVLFLCFQLVLATAYKSHSLFTSLIALLLTLSLSYLFSRVLVRPLEKLTSIAAQLTPAIIPLDRNNRGDEIAELSKAIREMADQLRNRIDEISKEKEYLQTVLKGMIEGVLVVDERGRIQMVNDTFRSIFSLPSQVSNRSPLEVIRSARLESTIQAVLQEGKSSAFEMEIAGTGKVLDVNVVPILGRIEEGSSDSKVSGAIAVFHNITRLKELEKIRKDFVANVSHELRTPLTTIKGYAETLLGGALKEEVAPQFLQVMNRQADRLTKIVEDLLALSRIESREFQLKIEPISAPDLIEDALDAVREPAEKKRISLTHESPTPLTIYGDRASLEQALINLLDNAIKYGREGGKVTVSAKTDHEEMRISVSDNGIGIPKEDLGRIFERFYRVDKGRSQQLGGTGLGLSIVKHIVQAHGGRVWAESHLGKGSSFYLVLPKPKQLQ